MHPIIAIHVIAAINQWIPYNCGGLILLDPEVVLLLYCECGGDSYLGVLPLFGIGLGLATWRTLFTESSTNN
jgi:hypothetical protein